MHQQQMDETEFKIVRQYYKILSKLTLSKRIEEGLFFGFFVKQFLTKS